MTKNGLVRIVVFIVIASAVPVSAQQAQTPSTKTDPIVIKDFDDEVARYMALRRQLRKEIDSLKPGSTSVEIVNTSDALARAIQRARPQSRGTRFFNATTTVLLKQCISDTVRRENLAPVLATIDDEGGRQGAVTVYLRFPASSQMATMPPSLLAVLPRIPRELEYRIIGTALVLRDVDAALILDVIPAAIPR